MHTNSMSVFKTGDRSYNTYICLHVIGLLWCMWCPFTMHTSVYHCLQGFASFLMSIYVYKGYQCLLCMSIYIVYVCLQCLLLLTLSRFTMSTSIFGVSVICLLDIRLLTMSAYVTMSTYVYVYSVRMSTAVSTYVYNVNIYASLQCSVCGIRIFWLSAFAFNYMYMYRYIYSLKSILM
jgi:hypothetical protein